MKGRRKDKGFTLIELLLVVVIIGILAAIVVPRLAGRTEEARYSKAKGDLSVLRNALSAYEIDSGKFPTTEQGLMSLIIKPASAPEPRNWKGPYIEGTEVPLDPWGNPYQFFNPGQRNPMSYDLYCLGPDGQDNTEDDSPNWR